MLGEISRLASGKSLQAWEDVIKSYGSVRNNRGCDLSVTSKYFSTITILVKSLNDDDDYTILLENFDDVTSRLYINAN